jgi:hypothetical protein
MVPMISRRSFHGTQARWLPKSLLSQTTSYICACANTHAQGTSPSSCSRGRWAPRSRPGTRSCSRCSLFFYLAIPSCLSGLKGTDVERCGARPQRLRHSLPGSECMRRVASALSPRRVGSAWSWPRLRPHVAPASSSPHRRDGRGLRSAFTTFQRNGHASPSLPVALLRFVSTSPCVW